MNLRVLSFAALVLLAVLTAVASAAQSQPVPDVVSIHRKCARRRRPRRHYSRQGNDEQCHPKNSHPQWR